jgi:hypothetical protein
MKKLALAALVLLVPAVASADETTPKRDVIVVAPVKVVGRVRIPIAFVVQRLSPSVVAGQLKLPVQGELDAALQKSPF